MKKIVVYTDGGARGNPGPSGIGIHISDAKGDVLKEVSRFLGVGTNNMAEYRAVVVALETLLKMFKEETTSLGVELRLDSELVKKQLTGEYKVKDVNLKKEYEKIQALRVPHFPHITFVHVPRERNKDADRLANEAMDKGA